MRQQVAALLGLGVPAEEQPQAQGLSCRLPCSHEFAPVTLGEFGVDRLARLVAERTEAGAVCTQGLNALRMQPRFGPPQKAAPLLATPLAVSPIAIATLRSQHTVP
jgi:hypothetical protein